jgi:hypothetical protein
VVGREACVPHYSLPNFPAWRHLPAPQQAIATPSTLPKPPTLPSRPSFEKRKKGAAGLDGGGHGKAVSGGGKGNPKRKVFPHLPLPLAPPPSPTNQPPPRFLTSTQTSLPRSGRDKERGTAPHNKARRARRAWAGRWGEDYTHGPLNATGNSLPYTRTQPTQAANNQQHHNKR